MKLDAMAKVLDGYGRSIIWTMAMGTSGKAWATAARIETGIRIPMMFMLAA